MDRHSRSQCLHLWPCLIRWMDRYSPSQCPPSLTLSNSQNNNSQDLFVWGYATICGIAKRLQENPSNIVYLYTTCKSRLERGRAKHNLLLNLYNIHSPHYPSITTTQCWCCYQACKTSRCWVASTNQTCTTCLRVKQNKSILDGCQVLCWFA